jgi:hypothetical protein
LAISLCSEGLIGVAGLAGGAVGSGAAVGFFVPVGFDTDTGVVWVPGEPAFVAGGLLCCAVATGPMIRLETTTAHTRRFAARMSMLDSFLESLVSDCLVFDFRAGVPNGQQIYHTERAVGG